MGHKTNSILLTVVCLASLISCARINKDSLDYADRKSDSYSSFIRSYSEAETCAKATIKLLGAETKGALREIVDGGCVITPETKVGEKDTLLYYFNFTDNSGFAIINANKRADPFICVTESGHYYKENGSGIPPVDEYLNHVKEQLRFNPAEIEPDPPYIPYSYEVDVYDGSYIEPLLKTKWGLSGVYGAYCPNGLSGCVATAIAQILAYYEYPSIITLSTDIWGFMSGTILPLNWYLINFHKVNHSTSSACNPVHYQISTLLRDIGENVNMEYGIDESVAFSSDVPAALEHYGYLSDSYTEASIPIIKASLDNYRPVYMRGWSEYDGGHAWVADGYKDYRLYRNTYAQAYPAPGYYLVNTEFIEEVHALHINWGWDGVCNGYFNFNCYDTTVAVSYDEASGFSYQFSSGIKMITNIRHN
jgi:hypothetical protein